jgi:predicted NodU family carbamoyl transferase
VRFRKDNGALTIESGFYNMRFVAPADHDAYLARAAALADEKAALTPEQRTKLRAVSFTPECVRSDADKLALVALWEKYAAAPAAEEPKIATELKQAAARIAVASMPQAAADFAESAKQVRTILTPEQIQTLRTRNR